MLTDSPRPIAAAFLAVTVVVAAVAVAGANAYVAQPQSPSAGRGVDSAARTLGTSRSQARTTCGRPFSSTLLEMGSVRVYDMPNESELRDRAIAARPLFACLKSTGRSRPLDLPEESGEKHAYWVEVDPQALAVSAPLVAYAYTQYYLDTHETWIRVRDLRTGKVVRSCEAGGDIAPGRLPHVDEIVLGSDGAVAWSAEEYKGRVVRACGAAGARLLDSGESLDLESLTLENGVVSWVDEGSVREAPLE